MRFSTDNWKWWQWTLALVGSTILFAGFWWILIPLFLAVVVITGMIAAFSPHEREGGTRTWLSPIECLAPMGGPGSSSYEDYQAERRHQESLAASGSPPSYPGMTPEIRAKIDRMRAQQAWRNLPPTPHIGPDDDTMEIPVIR